MNDALLTPAAPLFNAATAAGELFCVIGNPVAHSHSPWIHARFAELTGLHMHYDRLLAPTQPAGFEQSLRGFIHRGGRGCNITLPFKAEAARLADARSQRVELAGAANTLLIAPNGHVRADNTDGLGLVTDLTHNIGCTLAGAHILLLGAGGAAAGVLAPLMEQRPKRIIIINRTIERAQVLMQRHALLAETLGVALAVHTFDEMNRNCNPPTSGSDSCQRVCLGTQGFDLLINATAASLKGDVLSIPTTALHENTLVYDMMYGPAAAPFLRWAQQHGVRTSDGLGMLVEQAAASFALWHGVTPPTLTVLEELRCKMMQDASRLSSFEEGWSV